MVGKRKDGAWYYQIELPGSTRQKRIRERKSPFATKKEAEKAEAAAIVAAQTRHAVAVPAAVPQTLHALFQKFLAARSVGIDPLSPKTQELYRDQERYIDPALLTRDPASITDLEWSYEISRLLTSGGLRGHGLGVVSVRLFASAFASAYSWACHERLLKEHPLRWVKKPPVEDLPKQTLEPEEIERLLAAATGFWKLLFWLAENLGTRRGEILALRWADFKNGRFRIQRSLCDYRDADRRRHVMFKTLKQKGWHDITVPPSVLPIIEQHRREQAQDRAQFGPTYQDLDLIFAQEDGSPIRPNYLSSRMGAMCRKLGLPEGISLHSFRHTHASQLIHDGIDIVTVSKRLGHRKVRTTLDAYSHLLRGADEKAAAITDERLRQRLEKQQSGQELVQ